MGCGFACISWEAAATLITGLAAVGGAVCIGLRQIKISDRQAEIVAGQLRLEELKARMALWDERMKIYNATEAWLIRFLQDGARPSGEVAQTFGRAVDRAEFLFSRELRGTLKGWWDLANQHHYHEVSYTTEGGDHLEKSYAIFQQLKAALDDLPTTLGPRIDLSNVM